MLRSELNLFICIASGLNFGSACGLKPTAVGNVRCCCSMLMTLQRCHCYTVMQHTLGATTGQEHWVLHEKGEKQDGGGWKGRVSNSSCTTRKLLIACKK